MSLQGRPSTLVLSPRNRQENPSQQHHLLLISCEEDFGIQPPHDQASSSLVSCSSSLLCVCWKGINRMELLTQKHCGSFATKRMFCAWREGVSAGEWLVSCSMQILTHVWAGLCYCKIKYS